MAQRSFVDFRLGLSGQAWAVLHLLDGEPSFAPFNLTTHEYELEIKTSAFYNGRERGFVLDVQHSFLDNRDHLYVVCANQRSSDSLVIYKWTGPLRMNPPTVADLTEQVYNVFLNSPEEAAKRIREIIGDYLDRESKEKTVASVMES